MRAHHPYVIEALETVVRKAVRERLTSLNYSPATASEVARVYAQTTDFGLSDAVILADALEEQQKRAAPEAP
jgi:hypothetical protein